MTALEETLRQGIAAARAGQAELARQLLAQVLRADPHNEVAWLWMSSVVASDEERIYCLQQILATNPHHELALKGLRALGVEPSLPEAARPSAKPAQPPPVAAGSPGGVPIASAQQLSVALSRVDPVVNEALAQARTPALDVTWVRSSRAPRGAGLALQLSPTMLTALIGAFAGVALIALGVAVFQLIGQARQQVVTAPVLTATATLPPSPVPSPRPTRTPTPTLAPGQPTFTPAPTMPVMAPRGDLSMGLTATPPYIATRHPTNQALGRAIEAFYAGDYEGAVEQIRAARESGPDAVDSYFFEGMALVYMGELDEAAVAFRSGLDMDPNFAPLHAGMGVIHYQRGAVNQALAANERAKEIDPGFVMAYLNLAEIYRDEGDFEAALAEIDTALAMYPYNVEVLVAQGRTLLASGNRESAAAVGNLAVYIDPGSEEANLLLAEARLQLGQLGPAAALLEEYIAGVNPNSADVWAVLGQAYFAEGDPSGALDAYRRALLLDEENRTALIARGSLYLSMGDFARAYDDFEHALNIRDDIEARYGRAISAFALGNYTQALRDIELVREQRPEDDQAMLLYARALLENQQYEEAITAANGVLELPLSREDLGFAFETRGRAYYHLGEYGNAILDIGQALQIAETGTRHYYRALLREATGDVRGAILELEWVLFWDQLFSYPFGDEAAARLEALTEMVAGWASGTPTPTPVPTLTPTATTTSTPTATATPTPTVTSEAPEETLPQR